jgi:hypothetical protein
MRGEFGRIDTAISATTAEFFLPGGRYQAVAVGTWGGGNFTLQIRAADGSSFVNASSVFSADAKWETSIPSGWYKWVRGGSAGPVTITIQRVPIEE